MFSWVYLWVKGRASGSVDLIGSVAQVIEKPEARLLLSDKIYRLQLSLDKIIPGFFVYAFGSTYVRHQIKSVISGAEGLANNIAKGDIIEFAIVVPPIMEQHQVTSELNNDYTKQELLSKSLGESISLLKERRSALITAAVTGQIDPKDMAA